MIFTFDCYSSFTACGVQRLDTQWQTGSGLQSYKTYKKMFITE